MAQPLSPFRLAAAEAVAGALGVAAADLPVATPPDPALGDYAVGCFPAAKALRAAPAALATRAAAAITRGDLIESATAAGPYVNLRVRRDALYRHLFQATLGAGPIIPPVGAGQTICIDFSSPNIAKPLAYHHIRSTVIGQALCNLNRALGYRVVGINHLGDWGTTFGMLLAACHRWGTPEPLTVTALNELYVRARKAAKEEPALENEARDCFRRLEAGEPALRALWQRVREESLAEFQEVYDALDIHFDEVRGESEYEHDVPKIIDLLMDKGLAVISEGALVVDLAAEGMPPLILRKADGATIYATRDLAAAISRHDRFGFSRSLYVVDKGQALHFKQLFTTLKKAGFDWVDRAEHVPFGLVRLGGKKAGTRSGDAVLLKKVISEAEGRVRALLGESNPDLPPERAAEVAHMVGVGVIKFANLSAQREKDVDFEWEDVVSLRGDAGPYVQYAHARTASLLRAGGVAPAELAGADAAPLVRDEEWALARMLTDLGDEVARAAAADEPHILARYLLDLCAAFSRWYTLGNQDPSLKVVTADAAATRARLALAAATQVTLKVGLGLLGLEAPEVM